ncbi:MAG TPA: helix-turn-helix domain-containing protein [Longimicrobium sp.]|nr:helix-turn-helix domain-containing protein [Longimicrobium sp.]
MSAEAQAWAITQRMGNAVRKLVLWGLAGHAHKDGTSAWAGVDTLAEYAECDRRTVQRHLASMLAQGFIREGDQRLVQHLDPRYRPIVYDLAMTAETLERWRAEYEARALETRRGRAAAAGAESGSRGAGHRWRREVEQPTGGRGDNLSPLETEARGDSRDASGVTAETFRGDTAVTQPVREPSVEPNSQPCAGGRGGAHAHDEPTSPDAPPPERISDALAPDPDACDVDSFLSLAVRVCNRGMRDNPAIGETYNPIPSSHGSRELVRPWLDRGPRRVILAAIYQAAVRYKPGEGSRRQIRAMGYFEGPVAQALDRHAAGLTIVPQPPVPGSQAEFVLSDPRNERPGAGRTGGDSGLAPLAVDADASMARVMAGRRGDAERAARWLEANPLEAEVMRLEEERWVLAQPGMARQGTASRIVQGMVEQRVQQRALNRMADGGASFHGETEEAA